MFDRAKVIKGLKEIQDEAYSRWVHCQYTKDEIILGIGQYMDDAIGYLKQSEWISVKDRLPKLAGRYLAYRPQFWAWGRGQATVCYWDGKNWFDDYVDTEEYKLSEDSVSHWMPLPEPPEVKQE